MRIIGETNPILSKVPNPQSVPYTPPQPEANDEQQQVEVQQVELPNLRSGIPPLYTSPRGRKRKSCMDSELEAQHKRVLALTEEKLKLQIDLYKQIQERLKGAETLSELVKDMFGNI